MSGTNDFVFAFSLSSAELKMMIIFTIAITLTITIIIAVWNGTSFWPTCGASTNLWELRSHSGSDHKALPFTKDSEVVTLTLRWWCTSQNTLEFLLRRSRQKQENHTTYDCVQWPSIGLWPPSFPCKNRFVTTPGTPVPPLHCLGTKTTL